MCCTGAMYNTVWHEVRTVCGFAGSRVHIMHMRVYGRGAIRSGDIHRGARRSIEIEHIAYRHSGQTALQLQLTLERSKGRRTPPTAATKSTKCRNNKN
eukprot:scaffold10574_cov168-Isochrysis_galbana.AAC.3